MKIKSFIVLGVLSLNLSVAYADEAAQLACNKKIETVYLDNNLKSALIKHCFDGPNATYVLGGLLSAIKANKASFVSGSVALNNLEGFTSLALGGFRISAGVYIKTPNGKYITVQFIGPEGHGYIRQATYKLDPSIEI